MEKKLTWELIKNFLKTKLGIFTAAATATALIGAGVLIVVNLKPEDYRSISAFEVDGSSTVARDNKNFDIYKGMMLQSGDQVNVSKDGYLRLLLDEDKYITLEPDTTILLNASGNSADSNTQIVLTKGAITNEIQNKLSSNSVYEVTTPISTMSVRGTTYYISLNKDENGYYRITLVVFEGSIATSLIMPDGTVSEDVIINAGIQAEIGNDASSTHFIYSDHSINYEELPTGVLEYLIALKENGSLPDLPVSIEEMKEIIEQRNSPVSQEAPTPSGESLEEPPIEADLPEKPLPEEQKKAPTVKDEPKVPPAAETPEVSPLPTPSTPSAPSSGTESEPAPEPTPDPVIPPPTPSYTVTFIAGNIGSSTVFATQTVFAGAAPIPPLLSPDSDSLWYDSSGNLFSFELGVIHQNTTLYSQP